VQSAGSGHIARPSSGRRESDDHVPSSLGDGPGAVSLGAQSSPSSESSLSSAEEVAQEDAQTKQLSVCVPWARVAGLPIRGAVFPQGCPPCPNKGAREPRGNISQAAVQVLAAGEAVHKADLPDGQGAPRGRATAKEWYHWQPRVVLRDKGRS